MLHKILCSCCTTRKDEVEYWLNGQLNGTCHSCRLAKRRPDSKTESTEPDPIFPSSEELYQVFHKRSKERLCEEGSSWKCGGVIIIENGWENDQKAAEELAKALVQGITLEDGYLYRLKRRTKNRFGWCFTFLCSQSQSVRSISHSLGKRKKRLSMTHFPCSGRISITVPHHSPSNYVGFSYNHTYHERRLIRSEITSEPTSPYSPPSSPQSSVNDPYFQHFPTSSPSSAYPVSALYQANSSQVISLPTASNHDLSSLATTSSNPASSSNTFSSVELAESMDPAVSRALTEARAYVQSRTSAEISVVNSISEALSGADSRKSVHLNNVRPMVQEPMSTDLTNSLFTHNGFPRQENVSDETPESRMMSKRLRYHAYDENSFRSMEDGRAVLSTKPDGHPTAAHTLPSSLSTSSSSSFPETEGFPGTKGMVLTIPSANGEQADAIESRVLSEARAFMQGRPVSSSNNHNHLNNNHAGHAGLPPSLVPSLVTPMLNANVFPGSGSLPIPNIPKEHYSTLNTYAAPTPPSVLANSMDEMNLPNSLSEKVADRIRRAREEFSSDTSDIYDDMESDFRWLLSHIQSNKSSCRQLRLLLTEPVTQRIKYARNVLETLRKPQST